MLKVFSTLFLFEKLQKVAKVLQKVQKVEKNQVVKIFSINLYFFECLIFFGSG